MRTLQRFDIQKLGLVLLTVAATAGAISGPLSPARAGEIVLNAIDAGRYSSAGSHSPSNTNFVTGDNGSNLEYRSFFVFDLPWLLRAHTLSSVRLQLFNPATGYSSPSGSEGFNVSVVDTAVATLRAGGSGKTAIFNDLGAGGGIYKREVIRSNESNRTIDIDLGNAADNDLKYWAGNPFAFGGSLDSLNIYNTAEYVFGDTSLSMAKLVLETGESIWSNVDGGSFAAPSNWSGGVPDLEDDVHFALEGNPVVRTAGNTSVDSLFIYHHEGGAADATLDLTGGALTSRHISLGNWYVGPWGNGSAGRLTVSGGSLHTGWIDTSEKSSLNLLAGADVVVEKNVNLGSSNDGSRTSVTIASGASLMVKGTFYEHTTSGGLNFNGYGSADLVLSGNLVTSDTALYGNDFNSQRPAVTINSGGVWSDSGMIQLGDPTEGAVTQSAGQLTVNAGGSLTANNVSVEHALGGSDAENWDAEKLQAELAVNGGDAQITALQIRNRGKVELNGGTLTTNLIEVGSNGGGLLEVHSGQLAAEAITVSPGGSFAFTGGEVNVATFNGVLSQQGGLVTIGAAPGAMAVNGAYTQNAGEIEFELGGAAPGTEYDTLHVTGLATLAGDLTVSLLDGFEPSPGDVFTIVTADEISGQFAHVALPNLRGGLSLEVTYDYDANTVSLVTAGDFSADFDNDGDIDGDDLIAWQDGFGKSDADYAEGDANYDRVVDGRDLLHWQRQLSGPAVAESSPIPEPTGLGLVSVAAAVALLSRTRAIAA